MRRIIFIVFTIGVLFLGCEDKPGEGGQASIQGKVFVKYFPENCVQLLDSFYGVDEEVYIIAGDDPSYFERVRTGPDGTFWFPYLRTGSYQVYALSEVCSDIPTDKLEAITVDVNIEKRKQDVVLPDIEVIRLR